MNVKFSETAARQIVEATRKVLRNPSFGNSYSSNGYTPNDGLFFAQIVSSGPEEESDYSDNRYWIKRVTISTTGADTTLNSFTTPDETDSAYLHVTAEHLGSRTAGTHDLSSGDIVICLVGYDTADEGAAPRYFIVGSGGGSSLPTGQYVGQFLGVSAVNAPLSLMFPILHEAT